MTQFSSINELALLSLVTSRAKFNFEEALLKGWGKKKNKLSEISSS